MHPSKAGYSLAISLVLVGKGWKTLRSWTKCRILTRCSLMFEICFKAYVETMKRSILELWFHIEVQIRTQNLCLSILNRTARANWWLTHSGTRSAICTHSFRRTWLLQQLLLQKCTQPLNTHTSERKYALARTFPLCNNFPARYINLQHLEHHPPTQPTWLTNTLRAKQQQQQTRAFLREPCGMITSLERSIIPPFPTVFIVNCISLNQQLIKIISIQPPSPRVFLTLWNRA